MVPSEKKVIEVLSCKHCPASWCCGGGGGGATLPGGCYMPTKLIPRRILIVTIIGALLLVYTAVEPFWVEVAEYTISDPDIPESFDGVTIALIADVHHGPFFSQERLARFVERVNSLEPDLVALAGDYVHRSPIYIEPAFAELAKLRAPLGVFGVLGNHDHWEGANLTREQMQQAGITLLDNRAQWIDLGDERIRIGGIGDFISDTQDLGPTVTAVAATDFTVLLSHNPDYVEEIATAAAEKVDLVLCGHTHGGQVTLFGQWAPLVPSQYGQRYRTGLVGVRGMTTIISNGVGTITPPLRFFARPQLVLIRLVKPE